MRTIKTLVSILVLGSAAALVFIYSGFYDVGAGTPHTPATEWVLSTVMDRSVAQHAKGIKAPDLDGAAMIKKGLGEYREWCVVCHGAPGAAPTDIAQGLIWGDAFRRRNLDGRGLSRKTPDAVDGGL